MAHAIRAGRAVGFDRIVTYAGRRQARTHVMTFVERRADDRVHPSASPTLARVHLGAHVAIVARRPVGRRRIAARTRHGITNAYDMALIHCGTRDRVCPCARARLARIHLRAGIAVIASSSVSDCRIVTLTRRGVTGSRHMALILSHTRNRVCPGTAAHLARIGLRAAIAITARRPICRRRIVTLTRRRIARTCYVALIHRGTRNGVCPGTRTHLARIGLRTSIVITACSAIVGVGIAAHAGCRVTNTRNVALIQRHARHWVCPDARTRLARIGLRTAIAITARRPIGCRRIVTLTRRRITRTRHVALIHRHARHRVCPDARACLARIRLRTSIAVTACGAIAGVGIAAHACCHVTRTRNVALIQRSTHNGRVYAGVRHDVTRVRCARIAIVAIRIGQTRRHAVSFVSPNVRSSRPAINRSCRTRTRLVVVIDCQTRNGHTMGFDERARRPAIEVQITRRSVCERNGHAREARTVARRRRLPLRKCLVGRQSPNAHGRGGRAVQHVVVRRRHTPAHCWGRVDVADCIMLSSAARPNVVEDVVEHAHGCRDRRSGCVVPTQEPITRQ